jgi:hypothetical protein
MGMRFPAGGGLTLTGLVARFMSAGAGNREGVQRVEARADRIAEPWGARTPYARGERWPRRVDVELADGLTEDDVDSWRRSASILHFEW